MSNSKYKISVITPLHNEAPEIFEPAYNSMLNQSIGFKNIQWIIVLHNCDAKTTNYVTRKTKKFKNVNLQILNNEVHTPSSPKNYAMKFAEAKYIAYLDADDWYLPDGLKVAYEQAEKENASIVSFRREHSFQEPGLYPLMEITAWNQAEDKIICTKNNVDTKNLYSGQFYFLTSKLFKKSLLTKYNIHFEEDMPLAEDFVFAIEAFANASKIVILPRFIGYHYFIRSNSLAQKNLTSDEAFLWYAKTIKKAADTFVKYKVNADSLQGILLWISYRILATPTLKRKTREEISRMLTKYLKHFNIRSQDKFHSFEAHHQHYWIPNVVLNNPKDPIAAYQKQIVFDGTINLWNIIKSNTNTDFGKKYKFADIKTLDEYHKTVPLTTRERLDETLNLQTKIGESEILVNAKPREYLKNNYGELFMNTSAQNEVFTSAMVSICADKPTFVVSSRNTQIDASSNDGVGIKNLEAVLHDNAFLYAHKNNCDNFIFDFATAKNKKSLKQIFSLDTQCLIDAFVNFERENKTLFKKAGRKPIAKYLWPNLEVVIATKKSSNSKLNSRLNKYFGNVHFSNALYFTEEGIIGQRVAGKQNLYEIFNDKNVYELKNCQTNKICNFSNCKVGSKYYLVITNNAGLYRYISNHIVQIYKKNNLKIVYKILA